MRRRDSPATRRRGRPRPRAAIAALAAVLAFSGTGFTFPAAASAVPASGVSGIAAAAGQDLLSPAIGRPRDPATAVSCASVRVPVTLDAAVRAQVSGRLCVPGGHRHAAVQLLVSGATYDSYYWDFPYLPRTYSYVRAANAAGYPTLDIDRVGYGQSSREPSAALTATGQALVVHQLIHRLRAGTIGGHAFAKVILVGHSLGSGVCELEAALYHDVDGVVLTGVTHHISPTALTSALLASTHPAVRDPKFGLGYDPGYVTTIPGRRGAAFYAAADTDPAVVSVDELLKDVVSVTELTGAVTTGITAPVSLNITVPVLMAIGRDDNFFCVGVLASDCASAAALAREEAGYFGPAARLRTYVLPGAGHSLNLERNTASYQRAVMDWADELVPDA